MAAKKTVAKTKAKAKAPAEAKPIVIPSQAALVAAVPPPALTIKQVSDLAAQQMALEDRIEKGEALLKQLNDELRKMKQVTLPTAMQEAGVKALTLPNGAEVKITDFLAVNIKKDDERAAFAWLRANKYGSIIKTAVQMKFGKGEEALAKKLAAFCKKEKIPVELRESVAWQTLQAFAREKIQAGSALPPVINVVQVPTAEIVRPKSAD